MNNIVKTISTEIKNSRLFVKFYRYGRSDVQEVPQALPYGIDSNPIKDMQGLYVKTSQKGDAVLVGYVQNSIAELGELRLTSTDSDGAEKTYIWHKNDGTLEINGSDKNMVRYQELESAFNELKSDFNSLVSSYNSHTHITTATVAATPTPGVIAPTTSAETPSTADISGAKIDNIKTN